MPRLYLLLSSAAVLVIVLFALYTKIPIDLKVMDLEKGQTEASFAWPEGSYHSMLIGVAQSPSHEKDDLALKGTLIVSAEGKVVCSSPVDLKDSTPCNWLDNKGLTGAILNLSDTAGLAEIATGTTCDFLVTIDEASGGPYSLWINYTSTIGPSL